MQGDLYLNLRLNRQFLVYVDKGLYAGFEAFGLAKVLPLDGYLKIGQFIPAYGTKIDDHTTFIRGGPYFPLNPALSIYRQGLVFGEYAQQTGIEAGIAPSIFSLQVGLFDGYNMQGTEVKRYKVDNTFKDVLIDNTQLPAGTYFYQLQTTGRVVGERRWW